MIKWTMDFDYYSLAMVKNKKGKVNLRNLWLNLKLISLQELYQLKPQFPLEKFLSVSNTFCYDLIRLHLLLLNIPLDVYVFQEYVV